MSSTYAQDNQAIHNLLFRYAELLDAGDLEAVAALFEGASFGAHGGPETREGATGVLEAMRAAVALYDGKPATKHVTTNVIVELEPGATAAASRSYFTVLQARPDFALQPIIAGRYHDRFVKQDGRWRFAERRIFMDLIGDLRYHMRREVR